MGNPRSLHYACALAAGLFLTGCEDRQKMWRESEIREIAEDAAPASLGDGEYYGEPSASNSDVAALRAEIEGLRGEVEGLRNTVNGNADLSNSLMDLNKADADYLSARIAAIESRLGM